MQVEFLDLPAIQNNLCKATEVMQAALCGRLWGKERPAVVAKYVDCHELDESSSGPDGHDSRYWFFLRSGFCFFCGAQKHFASANEPVTRIKGQKF